MALAAQGFDRPRPKRVDARSLARVLRGLGLLQIDPVKVLIPAHELVPFSRLGSYSIEAFHRLLYRSRAFTEQWAHEASVIPVETWPLLKPRMARHRVRPWGFEQFLSSHADYVDWVLDEIRRRGPLSADELPDPDFAPQRVEDEWGWGGKTKHYVLEAHFGSGRLAVVGRLANFARVYELAERALPKDVVERKVEETEAQDELLMIAARAHGIGTAGDLADYFRMPTKQARARLDALVEAGKLSVDRVETWREPVYCHPRAKAPPAIDTACLLSPFDPLVWTRKRTERLFGFEYKLEIYVPAPKRKWGYYVLPFLWKERLVARVDLKADRDAACLVVRAAHRETHATAEDFLPAMRAELEFLASWLKLTRIQVARRGNLANALRRHTC